jgi:N-acetylated-alpha-linked acidic dipeptidase
MAKIESQSRGGWPWNGKTGRKLMQKAREINKRLASFEASFIDTDGLDQRTWYRNLVVAPGRDLGYGQSLIFPRHSSYHSRVWSSIGATTFPGLTESLTLDHNTTRATFEVQRLVKVLERASAGLSGSH